MALTEKQLNAINSCPVLKEFKDWFVAMDNENEPQPIKKYYFLSYGDSEGEQPLDKGTAKTTGVTDNGYSQIVVLTNEEHEDFVGLKYWCAGTRSVMLSSLWPVQPIYKKCARHLLCLTRSKRRQSRKSDEHAYIRFLYGADRRPPSRREGTGVHRHGRVAYHTDQRPAQPGIPADCAGP